MAAPKSVFVTGASRGIGLGLVHELLQLADVEHVFAGVRDPLGAGALRRIDDARLKLVPLDVTDDDSIRRAVHEIGAVVGANGLNLLINNAAILDSYWLHEPPNRETLLRMHNVNLVSPVIVTHHFLPLLRKAAKPQIYSIAGAAIINISSELGSNQACKEPGSGRLGFIPYKTAKAGLNRFTRTIWEDLEKEHILVAAFHPGWVQTDMGGPEAPTPLSESTSNLTRAFQQLNRGHGGGFFDNTGKPLPY